MRNTKDPNAEWKFPPLAVLRKLFEDVRSSLCHLDIFSTAVSCTVDPASNVATMVLNTRNYSLFKKVRQSIRDYDGMKGITFV